MASVKDERGYNQGFEMVNSTEVRMRRRAQAFVREMDPVRGGRILEIGCGTGEIAYWVAEQTEMSVLGTDISRQFIQQAMCRPQLPNLGYQVLDFNEANGLRDELFDYIIGNGILHHLYYSLATALRKIYSLLKPNGKILFFEPNIYNPYCTLIFQLPFLRAFACLEPNEMAFSKGFITPKLQESGFDDINVTYRDFLIPGVPNLLIRPLIMAGNILERIPVLDKMAQSLFIKAKKVGR